MNYDDKSKDSILEHANKLIGKSFGEIDKYNRLEEEYKRKPEWMRYSD